MYVAYRISIVIKYLRRTISFPGAMQRTQNKMDLFRQAFIINPWFNFFPSFLYFKVFYSFTPNAVLLICILFTHTNNRGKVQLSCNVTVNIQQSEPLQLLSSHKVEVPWELEPHHAKWPSCPPPPKLALSVRTRHLIDFVVIRLRW